MTYLFHPAAEKEYLESIADYESKQAGLGASFLYEFEAKMAVVCANPQLYQIEYTPDIRRATMKRFPYTVIYRVKQQTIHILAVAHQRRKPAYWIKRS